MGTPLTGAVLAGGRSSRFGFDKAVAPWGGRTLADSVAARLRAIFSKVLVIGKNPETAGSLGEGVRFVLDESEQSHPVVGILAALRESESDRVFVTACDMPFVDPELVRALCAASSGYAAATALWADRPQALFSVYSKECVGVMRLLLRERRPLRELFGIVRTRFLSPAEIGAIDEGGRSFLDIDTPKDYFTTWRNVRL